MSLNRYLPHLYILPEDDADRQLATGFTLHPGVDDRKVQVLGEAGGWSAVSDRFENDHLATMRKYPETRFLLLLDFDQAEDRLRKVRARIPADVQDRVFVLGVWTNPEDLHHELGLSLEEIGIKLAQECCDDLNETWTHQLLTHNAAELERLRASIRPELFP
jgi:hypothetical protein